jgi:hypothetical protein
VIRFFIGENMDVAKAGERISKTRDWRVENNMEAPSFALSAVV